MKLAPLSVFLLALVVPSVSRAEVVPVTPLQLNGWGYDQLAGSIGISYVAGPQTPPAGVGSIRMQIGEDGMLYWSAIGRALDGRPISELTELSYFTYDEFSGWPWEVAPALQLILKGADGSFALTFAPRFQDPSIYPANPQGPVVRGQWQRWDTLKGAWIEQFGSDRSPKALQDFPAVRSGATITGVRFLAGACAGDCGGWGSHIGYADALTLRFSDGTTTTFDFEPWTIDLALSKSAPASVLASSNMTWVLTVTNVGTATASDVDVTDPLPAGTTLVSATSTAGTCTGGEIVSCAVGALAPQQTATITIVATAPLAPTQITNTATVTNSPEVDSVATNNTASAVTTVQANAAIPAMDGFVLALLVASLAAVAVRALRS
jgi:uncharacterized repeat protein (TIGR01451 family)